MAAAKRKKAKKGSEWSWRLAGLALCAFFGLGVATGLSGSGRLFAVRARALMRLGGLIRRSISAPSPPKPPPLATADNPVALVKRADGFYALDAAGGLRGPVSPAAESDMPILSGSAIGSASGARLVSYASILVRAEAGLGAEISEMRIDRDDSAVIYLDRPAIPVTIDCDRADAEVAEAARILAIWRGHLELIAALDVTVPGQAVARLRPAAFEAIRRADAPRGAAALARRRGSEKRLSPEVTASR